MIWEDGALLGEYTTRSFGESPSEENVSRLSQILEASAHPKYSLSAKACEGILRRAERRGKVLPKKLEAALRVQSVSKSERDALGGKGILIQNERTGALSTVNNQRVCYGISSYDSNAMKSSNPNSGIYEAETSRTLDLNGGNPACNQGGIAVVEPIPINTMLATRDKALGRGTGLGIGKSGDAQFTISAANSHAVMCLNDQGGAVMAISEIVTGTLRAQEHGHQPLIFDARGNGTGETVATLTGDHESRISDFTAIVLEDL